MDTNTATVEQERAAPQGRVNTIDYKMVTFSLAGKDYGVDIMNVKEIAKAGRFTFVPNAAPYLRGVYNLRGDIIPVVDLRVFFHLPAEKKSDEALENMLILRLGEHVFGVVVDNIDKVVGIQSSSIQPPHPIFGDINIKYIHGVVENQNRLYIILDVVRIFAQKEEEKPRILSETPSGSYYAPVTGPISVPLTDSVIEARDEGGGTDLDFIKQTLFALKRFAATPLNEAWVNRRFEEWKKIQKSSDLQLKNIEDADQYLETFYSPYSGNFWGEDFIQAILQTLPDTASRTIQVWNPGCGKGFETFSFACVLRKRYRDAQIKIWANDSDLLAISQAPNMVFQLDDVPEYFREFLVKGRNGYTFNSTIKDSILFEYHDILNSNPFPELDIILARDILSFLPPVDQNRIISDFSEKLKGKGLVILGKNEQIVEEGWTSLGKDPVSAYTRKE
jgi:purine-binding chemotaxis protein CheW